MRREEWGRFLSDNNLDKYYGSLKHFPIISIGIILITMIFLERLIKDPKWPVLMEVTVGCLVVTLLASVTGLVFISMCYCLTKDKRMRSDPFDGASIPGISWLTGRHYDREDTKNFLAGTILQMVNISYCSCFLGGVAISTFVVKNFIL